MQNPKKKKKKNEKKYEEKKKEKKRQNIKKQKQIKKICEKNYNTFPTYFKILVNI